MVNHFIFVHDLIESNTFILLAGKYIHLHAGRKFNVSTYELYPKASPEKTVLHFWKPMSMRSH